MKTLIFLILIAFVHAQTFKEMQEKFNVHFCSKSEEKSARKAFQANKKIILEHNANSENEWKMDFNPYVFEDADEFIAARCQYREITPRSYALPTTTLRPSRTSTSTTIPTSTTTVNPANLPASVDYRNSAFPVLNQGRCGSCWAFALLSFVGNIFTLFSRYKSMAY
jgi:C1A family cysteine protease